MLQSAILFSGGAMMSLFLFFNTQTMHIKPKTHNSIAMFFSEKPYTYPGGIQTHVHCI
jgi:hypothetical protein